MRTLKALAIAAAATLGIASKAEAQQPCTFPLQIIADVQRFHANGTQEGNAVRLADSDGDGALDARIGYQFSPGHAGKFFRVVTGGPGYVAGRDSISYDELAGRNTTVADTIRAGGVNRFQPGACMVKQPYEITFTRTNTQPTQPTPATPAPAAPDTVVVSAEPRAGDVYNTLIIINAAPDAPAHVEQTPEPQAPPRNEHEQPAQPPVTPRGDASSNSYHRIGAAAGVQSTTATAEYNPLTMPRNFPETQSSTMNYNVGVAYNGALVPSDEFKIEFDAGIYKTFGSTTSDGVRWVDSRSAYETYPAAEQDLSGYDAQFGGRVAWQPKRIGLTGGLGVRFTGTDHTSVTSTEYRSASATSGQVSGDLAARLHATGNWYLSGGVAFEEQGNAADGTSGFAKFGVERDGFAHGKDINFAADVYLPFQGQNPIVPFRQEFKLEAEIAAQVKKHLGVSLEFVGGVINAPSTQTSYGQGQLAVQYFH